MWRCDVCKTDNPDENAFCTECGSRKRGQREKYDSSAFDPVQDGFQEDASLPKGWKCKKCGYDNDESSRFCVSCGQPRAKNSTGEGNNIVFFVIIGVLLAVIIFLVVFLFAKKSDDAVPNGGNDDNDTVIVVQKPDSETIEDPWPTSDPAPSAAPEPTPAPVPTPTPVPTPEPAPAVYVAAPENPITPYGQAYRNYAAYGTAYSTEDALHLIKETYYGRKDANGDYREGYSSGRDRDNSYGYDFGFYYGDDLLYYAEVRTMEKAEIKVKLYYWGGQLIGCRDYRASDSELHTAGHPIFEAVAQEFSYVYALGAR